MILSSGAVISGFNDSNNWTQGPNVVGDDQLVIMLCIGPAMCTLDITGTGPKGPGSVGPFNIADYYFV